MAHFQTESNGQNGHDLMERPNAEEYDVEVLHQAHPHQQSSEPEFRIGSAAGDAERKLFGNQRRTTRQPTVQDGAAGKVTLSCRKYHMESDIFGTGMSPNRNTNGQVKPQDVGISSVDPAVKARDMGAAGRPTNMQHVDWYDFGRDSTTEVDSQQHQDKLPVAEDTDEENNIEEPELPESQIIPQGRNGNARENGGNPITGNGYKADAAPTHTQRRQFAKPLSTALW